MTELLERPPQRETEYRAAQPLEVTFPERTIDLIVMPYEKETVVEYKGRAIEEIVSRGAFDGVKQRTPRIRVFRDHDVRADSVIGKCLNLQPDHQEGLLAKLYISPTQVGDDMLRKAADGILDASAGFRLMPDRPDQPSETWENRDRRRLNSIWLHHIALTPDPAYEDAKVLAVRANAEPSERPARPNRDELRHWELEHRLAALDARYLPR